MQPLLKNYCMAIAAILIINCPKLMAQTADNYRAPQDTVTKKRARNESLTIIKTDTQTVEASARMTEIAVNAAGILKDTSRYDTKTGLPLTRLFNDGDLEYIAAGGINNAVVIFGLINKSLPTDHLITFKTSVLQTTRSGKNPLVLDELRASMATHKASINDNSQWKENVYRAYMARDYGTKLENTITITSATTELRENPSLALINTDGTPVTLAALLSKAGGTEKAAVGAFRNLTYPGRGISKETANENYKRALFTLMDLQQKDLDSHAATSAIMAALATDLAKGQRSNAVVALKNSDFFSANVPGSAGPILLTESDVLNAASVAANARVKAMEITMLLALHYGERDAVKLIQQIITPRGGTPASQTNVFTPKRLEQLTNHGTEKIKSVGFTIDKTNDMTFADLALVAVASPAPPLETSGTSFVSLQAVGASIVNQYTTIVETTEISNVLLFNPRIKLGSRHIEYRAANDPVDFVPDYANKVTIGQKGSRVTQNGVELRLESDLYFANAKKIIARGVKPVIYPEFGILIGTGQRSVGYDNSTTLGKNGPVPKFNNAYTNWGAHIGLNVGPIALTEDATILSTKSNNDPNRRFFDLSEGMTYFRYSALLHVFNLGFGKIDRPATIWTLDMELAGETNNEWLHDVTHTQNTAAQINSAEWRRDYARAHPNGVYDQNIVTAMIANGDTKASYAASNYAAIHLGVARSAFQLKASLGLYNLYAVPNINKTVGRLISNTFEGNVFGAVGLTYNFGFGGSLQKTYRKEAYQTIGGVESEHKVEIASSDTRQSSAGPRDHAIFTNKRTKAKQPKPAPVTSAPTTN